MDRSPLDPAPRAVLFDLDDTLCDFSAARAVRLRYAFSLDADGQPAARPDAELDRMIAESIAVHPHGVEHFEVLFAQHGRLDPRESRAAAAWYRENRFHGLHLFPDAIAVLGTLRRAAVTGATGPVRPLGIISNGPAEVQGAKVDLLGLRDFVDFVIISGEFGAAKPDRAVFAEALRLARVEATDAVFVGDSPEYDIAGAEGAGIRSVWMNARGEPWSTAGLRYHREIRSLAELPGLLGSPLETRGSDTTPGNSPQTSRAGSRSRDR